MAASTQDMIDQLLAQTTVAPQPSFLGVQAPPDQGQLKNLLGKLQQQQFMQQQQQQTPGEFGFLHDAGRAGMAGVGQQLGNIAQQVAAPQPQAPQQSPQASMLMQARAKYANDVAQGVPENEARQTAAKALVQAGFPAAPDVLEKAVAAGTEANLKRSQAGKEDAQAKDYGDLIDRRGVENKKDTWQTTFTDPKGLYALQTNQMGEVKRVELAPPPNASAQAAANMSPDAIKSMLDFYHTNGTLPPIARSPAMSAKFWQAEANYQAQTGNYAAAASANKMQAKSLSTDTANVQKQLGATSSYLSTMDKNIEKARTLSQQLDFGDVNKFNTALQAWERGTSDPKYAKYNVFFNSVAQEYGKLSSGNMGNVSVTDALRHETARIVPADIGQRGADALFDALKEEGQNKVDGYKEHLAQNYAQMQGIGSAERQGQPQGAIAPPAAAAAPVLNYNPTTGKFE